MYAYPFIHFSFISATAHRKTSQGHPLSTPAEFCEVYEKCVTGALQSIVQDPRLNIADSAHGAEIIQAAQRELHMEDTFAFLHPHFEELFVTESSYISISQYREQQRVRLHQLRTNAGVRDKFVSHVTVDLGASTRVGHMLFAMVLRHFTNSFLELQIDCLANKENATPGVQLDDEDRDVIAYICGYVIRRVLAKGSAYREGLAEVLGSRTPTVGVPSEWISSKDRGGLLYPSRDFYAFMEGCEQTLRGLTDLEHLSGDSLLRDQLKEDLLENPTLQQRWDLIGGSADTLMREKVTDLFLTIRGHASARRVMKQYARTQANNRSTKGLRKSLQSRFQDSV